MFTKIAKEYLDVDKDAKVGIVVTNNGQCVCGEKDDVLTCIAMLLQRMRENKIIDADDFKKIIKASFLTDEEIEEKKKELSKKESEEHFKNEIEDFLKEIEKIIED